MSDKPEWLQRMHDEQAAGVVRPPLPDELRPLFRRAHDAIAHHEDAPAAAAVDELLDTVRRQAAELADLRALRELLGGVDTDELGRVTLVPTAELERLRAIEQRLEAMASPDWAGSLRFPLVHGVDIVRLARMALTGEDPS